MFRREQRVTCATCNRDMGPYNADDTVLLQGVAVICGVCWTQKKARQEAEAKAAIAAEQEQRYGLRPTRLTPE